MTSLEYLAKWFADEMVGNEVGLRGFAPPEDFVALVVAEMVSNPELGWLDEESAYWDLTIMWPDLAGPVDAAD